MNRSRQGRIVSSLLRGLKSAIIDFFGFWNRVYVLICTTLHSPENARGAAIYIPYCADTYTCKSLITRDDAGGDETLGRVAGSTKPFTQRLKFHYVSSARISTSLQRASMYLVQARREGRETDVDQNLVISLPNAQVKNLFNNQPHHQPIINPPPPQTTAKKESKHTNTPESATDSSN